MCDITVNVTESKRFNVNVNTNSSNKRPSDDSERSTSQKKQWADMPKEKDKILEEFNDSISTLIKNNTYIIKILYEVIYSHNF